MTQVGYGPLHRIDGPPPIAPLYGLLSAAEAPAAGVRIVTDVDDRGIERWMNGVEVYPYPPDDADVFDTCATGSDAADKEFGGSLNHPQFGAMTVYLPETCTSYKVWSQEEFKARAVAALAAVESAALAREFLSGEKMLLNPHLSDGNGTFPNGDTVTNVANGLGLLEAEIAKSGRQGVIHCSPQLATAFREHFAIDNKTGVIRTINGIVVVADFGYVTSATPAGLHSAATGTQEWMYASGPIDIRRSEVFTMPERVEEALERGTGGASTGRPNSITYRAERYALVTWDTEVQAAVRVDRCQDGCS